MDRLLDRSQSILAVVDIQERLFSVFSEQAQARILRKAGILIQAARRLEVPIACTEQYPRGLGPTVEGIARLLPKDCPRPDKLTFSCWKCDAFAEAVEQSRRTSVVLCGIEAHVCVYQTALDLLDHGYGVVVAADAVGSRADADWRWALDAMRAEGAQVVPTETIVFTWLRAAGTPEFKEISRLVK